MADDILDLIDHAIANGGGMSDDAMRWAPDAGKAVVWSKQQRADLEAAFTHFGEAIRDVILPSLERVVRHVSAVINEEPLRTLLADRLRHERRMGMWRRKARGWRR